ncbi:hypothetical protein CBR_g31567 [Chara braunii]|uniref:F-box domain-containing protein n=1 Tax=Chara braunii TaxID=69332 RepID=A0A388LFE4_CHABU|nr:hypothetical protein CBR_g31567 [Chara braunii]|eukprot:GBG81011.1 hypothetical protein CBR_g31567 [Chara braunii]
MEREDVLESDGDLTCRQQTCHGSDCLRPKIGEVVESASALLERGGEGTSTENGEETEGADVGREREHPFLECDAETPPQGSDDPAHRPFTHQHVVIEEYHQDEPADDDVEDGRAWGDLGLDALVHIFSFLSLRDRFHVGPVCKSWYQASWDPGCWKEADTYKCCPSPPTHIEFHRCVWNATRDVVLRGQGLLIDLSTWYCKSDTLEFIANNCPLLQRLVLRCFSVKHRWIEAVDAIANRCLSLCHLEIHNRLPTQVGKDFTQQLVPRLPQLTFLTLGLTWVDDDAMSVITDNLPNLEILTLIDEQRITDASLACIGRKLRRLKTLEVSSCTSLTRSGLESLRLARADLQVVRLNQKVVIRRYWR